MAKKYRIGQISFDTKEEYDRAMADVRKIYKITHAVDIYDPEIALHLYQSIREGKIKFYSKIGRKFFLDLADIVAQNAQKEAWEKKKKIVQTDRGRSILGAVCLVAAIGCFGWYFWSDYTNHRGNEANEYLKKLREEPQETVELVSNDAYFKEDAPEFLAVSDGIQGNSETENISPPEVLTEYQPIVQTNSDFAGWITIEGTRIDYPVMLTKTNPDFYLKRNINKEEDINGTLFLDARTDLISPSTNMIIYGHNMKSGQMFGSLKKYLDETYWKEHKQIMFDTIYEKGIYEIIAVCLDKVQYQDEKGFRYYDFIQADSKEAYDEFLENVKRLSVFSDQEMPEYGTDLLTLSTCNNYVEDGRLFLVAKKCRDAE